MTKNVTIGFILAIILTLLIGISNVYAESNPTNIYFNYSDFEELLNNSDSVYKESINYLLTYLEKYEDEYYVFVYFNTSLDSSGNLRTLSTLGFRLTPKTDYIQTNVGLQFESNNYVSIGNYNDNRYGDNTVVSQESGNFSSSYGFFFNYDFDTYIAGLDVKIESSNFSNKSLNNFVPIGFNIDSSNTADFSQGVGVYIYSNFDFNFVSTDYNIIFDGVTVSNGGTLLSYHNYDSGILISHTHANDLSNRDMAVLNIDFSNVFSTDYTYQISTEYTDWIDITNDILSASLEGYYYYNYNLYYNTEFKARVLDSTGNVIEECLYTVNEDYLTDFISITSSLANDLSGLLIRVIRFDLRNLYSDDYVYQYSYDEKIYYDMEVLEDSPYYLIHPLNHPVHFRVLNSTGDILYSTEYFSPYYEMNKEVTIKETADLNSNGDRQIDIVLDFSQFMQFSDLFNYDVIINGVSYGEIYFYNTSLTNDNYVGSFDIQIKLDNSLLYGVCYTVGAQITGSTTVTDFDTAYDNIRDYTIESTQVSFFTNFTNALNYFKDSIIGIFQNVSYLFYSLPVVLQYFFIFIFTMILFIFLIRFIL